MAVKILAVDDSATMRRVLEMTFAGEAVDLETVSSGEAAVERASQSPPDLVIVDASMSMSGYDVAAALKSKAATEQVAILVLASQHTPFDEAKGKASGVDGHILKPYDSQAMIDKVAHVLGQPRAGASAAPRPAPSARSSAPGVGKPASASPSGLRSTVTFGTPQQGRPVLELADIEPPKIKPPKTGVPKLPSRPAAKPPARPASSGRVAAAKPAPPKKPTRPARPVVRAPAKPAAKAAPAAVATAPDGDMAAKLGGLGLDKAQIEGVLTLSREVIEQVVWEVVPDLAEAIIKEEIRRLTAD